MERKDEGLNLNKEAEKKLVFSKQINWKNIMKILILLAMVPVLIVLFFFTRGEQENEVPKEKEQILGEQGSFADNLDSTYQPKKNLEDVITRTQEEKYIVPEEEESIELDEKEESEIQEEVDPIAEFYKQQELQKLEKLYEARSSALKKKSNNGYTGSSEETSNTNNNGMNSYPGLDPSIFASGPTDPNMQKQKKEFLKKNAINQFILKHSLIPSISKYEIKTGTYIPITIVGAIYSDLPGQVVALIREDVYDSNTGAYKLIPQGSKLFGKFSSEVSFGQERVQVIFNRMTLPNGKSIDLDSMIAGDMEGQSGLHDKVDTHMSKVVGSVIMSTLLGGASGILTNNNNRKKDTWVEDAGDAGGEQIINIGNKYADKVLNVQPSIYIRPGTRGTMVVDQDIILEKYEKEIEYLGN
ncbi:TrbI/VirB10 family protein [Fusobacterium necrophorum]|uniref:TrbI/VirB10 family protein n=1 Tax=Fusobacterium necrophorum TaxID=859 RepID=A0A4V1QX50_9FUSO|nr:TrbI/VirB10 family protein [Fusobacterium necrophorum]RXZ68426.1 TrbI/VirB10 family protein [Fusobacterium necrophorum]